jgi:uncharacterized SAM-binding protein YcdF (DUF218 family)
MAIYFHKLLPLIFSPLMLCLIGVTLSLSMGRRRLAYLFVVLLVVFSTPITGKSLWLQLERDYPPVQLDTIDSAEAVVVLSGSLHRLFAAIDIMRHGKAKLLILTEPRLPWDSRSKNSVSYKTLAVSMGIDPSKILIAGPVQNTEDEAVSISNLVNTYEIESTILVTSSFHMSRAIQIFAAKDLVVNPYPVDFRAEPWHVNWLSFIPSHSGLNQTSAAIREIIGRIYYWLFASSK